MAEETDTQVVNQERDFEAEARKTGWRPETEYQGAKEKWIPAKDWVERGESFIPFLQSSNRELKGQISARDERILELERQQRATAKALEEFKEEATETAVETLETQKNDLIEQIAKAHEEGDIRAELRLRDTLSEVSDTIRQKKAGGTTDRRPANNGRDNQNTDDGRPRNPSEDPVFQGWVSENQWFRDDPMMAGAAISLINHMNADASFRALPPRERLDRVGAEVQKRFGSTNTRRQAPNKVEGGGRTDSTGGGGGRARAYNDLPDSAKAICDQLSKRFVGKTNGKGEIRYKTIDDYRAQYVRDYFDDEWGAKHLNA